jgi:uncharacterized protein with von Willebrand factor type A (vWA) domain
LYRDPETLEDAAALPYADIFLPGHNLASLDQLSAALAGALRPARHDALRNKL